MMIKHKEFLISCESPGHREPTENAQKTHGELRWNTKKTHRQLTGIAQETNRNS